MRTLGVPMERAGITIDRLGNTGAATVYTVLDEALRARRVRRDELLWSRNRRVVLGLASPAPTVTRVHRAGETMRAVAAMRATTDPRAGVATWSGLRVGEWPESEPPEGWTTVEVRAAEVNHHDLWTLRGIGIPLERLPVVLGAEAAGVDDEGREVLVYPVIGTLTFGDENLDPACQYLSVDFDGTFAERVAVPRDASSPNPPS